MKVLLGKSTRLVAVIRNPQNPAQWLVCCRRCKPGFLSGLFGDDEPTSVGSSIRYSTDWTTAVTWATQHSREHEMDRCATCGQMPPRGAA